MKSNLMTKITIVLLTFAIMGDMVVIPAAGGIFGTFYDASPVLLNFILTGPMLISVGASFLCGFLARSISKKNLIVSAYVLFIISACGGALIENIYYIVVMRAIAGFTYGIVGAAATGLIAEIFIEEKVRSSMMGIYNGMMSLCGVVMSLVSGFLAVGSWKSSFYVYLAAIPILILAVFFLPKTPPEGISSEDASESKDRLPLGKFVPVVLAFLTLSALYYIVVYYIAIYVEEMQLGDASTSGMLGSVATIGSFVACMFFSVIYMRIKRATPILIFFCTSIAYLVMAFPTNVWIVGIMSFLAGAAYGLAMSYYFMHASMIVPSGVMSIAMGIINAAIGLGGFLSSYILELYKAVLGVEIMAPTFLYIGITLAIGGVVSIILTIRARKETVNIDVG